MKKWIITTLSFLMLDQSSAILAKEPTPLQFFMVIKKIFPEAKEIAIFMSTELWEKNQEKIKRELAMSQLKGTIYLIETPIHIGKYIGQIGNNSILAIFNSDLLLQKSSMLYILSKCKEKQIALVTSSKEYSDLGALVGLINGENGHIELVVNLKHNEHLKSRFDEAFIQQLGITLIQ